MLEEIIQQYCNHFALQISEIADIKNRLFQKILYTSLLDSMGKARFPDGENRDRLAGFMDTCSTWTDRNRISVVQLGLLGKEQIEPGSSLSILIEKHVSAWQYGTLPRSEADPLISEIPAEFQTHKLVKQARYAELFCHYRHTLIHEFREPGYGMEVSQDGSTPYYLGVSFGKRDDRRWELVFPVEFFKTLCEDCLSGLRTYLLTEKIDPYTCYSFGSCWPQNRKSRSQKYKKVRRPRGQAQAETL